MRAFILSSLAFSLLLTIGCSDIPSVNESTADTSADLVATMEGGSETSYRYSASYLRLWEVRREANKAIVVERALADGSSDPAMYQFKAYADARAQMDMRFRAELANQRERIHRSWIMSDFDPTRSAYSHRDEDRSHEYLKTLLSRYDIDYVQLRRMGNETPDEFLSPVVLEDQAEAEKRAEFAESTSSEKYEIPLEFLDLPPVYDPDSGLRDHFDLGPEEVGGEVDPLFPGATASAAPGGQSSAEGAVAVDDPLAGNTAISSWLTLPTIAADGTQGTIRMDVSIPSEFQEPSAVPGDTRSSSIPSEFIDQD